MGMAVPVDRGRYLALDPTYWWAAIIGVPRSRAHSFGKRPAGHFLDMVPSRSLSGSAHGSHMCVHVLEGSVRVPEVHVIH